VALIAGACSSGNQQSNNASGGQNVNVIGTWAGDEQKAFLAMVAPWEQQTGNKVKYTGTRDINTVLTTGVASNVLPDLAGLPGPGQMAEFAKAGALKPLDSVLDVNTYKSETAPSLVQLGTIDGKIVGVFIKSAVKGLIWYNPKVFTGTPPATWDDMLAVKPPSGTQLFCAAFESGDASGWPASDDLANIVMRQAGEKVYIDWYTGKHKWSSPEIKQAYQTFGQMVKQGNVYGGPNTVLSSNFQKAGDPLFTSPPGCLFMEQATFMTAFFEQNTPGVKAGTDYNFFPHPKFNDQYAGNVEGFFDSFVMYNSTPQAKALMQYMATDQAQQIWVDQGGTLAASKNITKYPNAIFENASKIATGAKNILLTAGDYMPADMQHAFWKSLLDFTNDQSKLDSILASLDQVQATAYQSPAPS
jgi:alpha-glucoside transport system substrate-binding protein